ncbi:unnamed protein product [Orchesella dallaii]|uniref:Uncharacterized protein n=1 Tax=Orchesella dallaii TaxID=48710 RepID=A0ABP1QIV4_9HEXA
MNNKDITDQYGKTGLVGLARNLGGKRATVAQLLLPLNRAENDEARFERKQCVLNLSWKNAIT